MARYQEDKHCTRCGAAGHWERDCRWQPGADVLVRHGRVRCSRTPEQFVKDLLRSIGCIDEGENRMGNESDQAVQWNVCWHDGATFGRRSFLATSLHELADLVAAAGIGLRQVVRIEQGCPAR